MVFHRKGKYSLDSIKNYLRSTYEFLITFNGVSLISERNDRKETPFMYTVFPVHSNLTISRYLGNFRFNHFNFFFEIVFLTPEKRFESLG